MNVLAVDPGMSGAVILLGAGALGVRRDFKNVAAVVAAITELGALATVAVVEMVGARPGQGTVSMFSFGHASGAAVGALNCLGFSLDPAHGPKRLLEVHPLRWQNYFRSLEYWPTDDLGKLDSITLARRYYPSAAPFLLRKKDHNTADAILIGLWYILANPETGSVRKKKARPRSRALKTPKLTKIR